MTPSISHRTHTQKILIAISTAYTRTCEARRNGGWGGGGEGDQQELAPTIILTPPSCPPPIKPVDSKVCPFPLPPPHIENLPKLLQLFTQMSDYGLWGSLLLSVLAVRYRPMDTVAPNAVAGGGRIAGKQRGLSAVFGITGIQ